MDDLSCWTSLIQYPSNMAGLIQCLLLMLLSASTVISVSGESIIIQNSCSPLERENCQTLQNCLRNYTICFAMNTHLNFTEKNYVVMETKNTFFIINDTSNILLSGNNATIQCSTRVGFAFIGVTNLTIQGLHFKACGKAMPVMLQSDVHLTLTESSSFFMDQLTTVALLLADINGLTLHKSSFSHSIGYGMVIINSRWINISSSNFTHNNLQALQCYKESTLNTSCCEKLSASTHSQCIGGNLVIISTDQASFEAHTMTSIVNTQITHGVNLDTQITFNENYSYAAGGLSIFTGHSRYSELVNIERCLISNNIGQSSEMQSFTYMTT